MIELRIPGNPIAKKRPRFARKGKFVQTYNDQETEEGRFLWEVKTQYNGSPLTGPLEVKCDFIVARPKSHYGTGRNAGMLKPGAPTYCMNDKDVDNYVKFALDCLNQTCWVDDRQVVAVAGIKRYGDSAMTVVKIHEWPMLGKPVNHVPKIV